MSRRREMEQRLRKLEEIGEIMRSMKNLALMETRKLARFLDAQYQSVHLIETAAADFLHFHPQLPSNAAHALPRARLVIGAERGFCGDFNEELLAELDREEEEIHSHEGGNGRPSRNSPILAVGNKLCARLKGYPGLAGQFDGPTVAEDVTPTLNRLVPEILRLQEDQSCHGLLVLHHRSRAASPSQNQLLPPFAQLPSPAPKYLLPPLLNLSPERYFAGLVRHYLFAALHEIFYTSLMAENQRRIQQLEGAIQRLEEKNADLARQSRVLRQEEITEEIEVLLLSAERQKASGGLSSTAFSAPLPTRR